MSAVPIQPEYEEQLDQSSVATEKPFVIAFLNLKSGSGKADDLAKLLSGIIGEENIYIFGKDKPAEVIARVCTHPDSRVIVGGGDGSVNWILSIIDHLDLQNVSVGIIPNGTGNDTSRYLGWGQRQFGLQSVLANVKLMTHRSCPMVDFDRWQIFFSLNKDKMKQRNVTLQKTKEVPATHLWALIEENTTQSGQKVRDEFLLPKYYKCMMRLDELDYLQRFKYLHQQHWPQEYRPSLCEYQDGKYLRTPNPKLYNNNNENNNHSQPNPEDPQQPQQQQLQLPADVVEHEIQRNKYRELLEKQSKWLRFTWSFNNYLSLGLDAQVMNDFGIHRDNNPCCYQCRCCTMVWIGTCSTATCCQCKKKPMRYRIDLLYKEGSLQPINQKDYPRPQVNVPHPLSDGEEDKKQQNNNNNNQKQQQQQQQTGEDIDITVEVDSNGLGGNTTGISSEEEHILGLNWVQNEEEKQFLNDPQHLANNYKWLSATFDPLQYGALVLLNIPSYAGGINIWGKKAQKTQKTPWVLEDSPQETDDGKLEAVAFTGFINMQFTVSTEGAAYRVTQLEGLRIYMENDGYMQLDGEAWIQPAGIVEIYRSKCGKMLRNMNPDYPKC